VSELPEAPSPAFGPELLELGRRDRAAARKRLRGLAPAALARACQELRPRARSEFLMLTDHPEQVVPLLPEAELAATILAGGMSEASWLLEIATPEQRVACLDLDAWQGDTLLPARVREWIDALMEAGRPTLVKALEEADLEFWLVSLRDMTDVCVIGKEDEPPTGWFTEDGVCYFRPVQDDDFARVKEIAGASFDGANPLYWSLVYGLLFESQAECQEYALRWRTNRLADLGFPELEAAMQAYRKLPLDEAPTWELDAAAGAALAPLPASQLPRQLRGSLLGEALGRLEPGRGADLLGYVLAVANALAVADGLRLSDSDSIPRALEKAVRGIDRGLRELAKQRQEPPERVLEKTRPLDLFRIGATLDDTLRCERAPPADDEDDDSDSTGGDGLE
jgi:hypothetical protein